METALRVEPTHKKTPQIVDGVERTFPLRLEGVATKQLLVLLFGR